jgi:hypothetical protein
MVRSVHVYPNDKFDYSKKFEDLYFGEQETKSQWTPIRNYDWILMRDIPELNEIGFKKGDLYFEVTGKEPDFLKSCMDCVSDPGDTHPATIKNEKGKYLYMQDDQFLTCWVDYTPVMAGNS